MKQKYTELETILSMALEKQSRRNAELMMNLDLARSENEILKAKEAKVAAEMEGVKKGEVKKGGTKNKK